MGWDLDALLYVVATDADAFNIANKASSRGDFASLTVVLKSKRSIYIVQNLVLTLLNSTRAATP